MVTELIVAHYLRCFYLDIDVSRRLTNVFTAVDGSGGAIYFLPFATAGLDNAGGM